MHISIIDDEKLLTKKIVKKLEGNGYVVSGFISYRDFVQNGDHLSDFYIVDISLGDGSGFDIIKSLREQKSTAPIMILSGYGDSEKIIYGLNIWADDYLTKPFIPEVLVARIKALLRRPKDIKNIETVSYKDIIITPSSGAVTASWKSIELARKEFFLLELFLRKPNQVIDRSEIIEKVWWVSDALSISDNNINVTLSKLRKKLGEHVMIEPIHGQGYILKG